MPRLAALVPGSFFQKSSWPTFVYQGVPYPLTHLDEYAFSVVDTGQVERQIAVTFGDHCFTRSPRPGDDPSLVYPASDRNPGMFCFERYGLSLELVSLIADAVKGKVWTLRGESFAIIPTVDHAGRPTYYGIIFSLERVKGLPVDLRMRVRTAFPYTEDDPVTYGHVRFRNLVELRVKGKLPPPIFGSHQKWPRLD